MITKNIEYFDGDTLLQGYLAYDESKEKKPAVLVSHDWSGRNDFACKKAEKLATLGYIGFAIDMFGKGRIGKTKEEKSALIQPFIHDRLKLQKRLFAALDVVQKLDVVDKNRIGAIGFCFGGLCVLDLARSGKDVQGVVSFHGLLNAPENIEPQPIKAKVLVLHGFDDPIVTGEAVLAFGEEMTVAKADWQLDIYGNAMHAFTNPEANDSSFGTVYNKKADERSFRAMREFFEEIFT